MESDQQNHQQNQQNDHDNHHDHQHDHQHDNNHDHHHQHENHKQQDNEKNEKVDLQHGKHYQIRGEKESILNEEAPCHPFGWLYYLFSFFIPTSTNPITADEGVSKCELVLNYINYWPKDYVKKIRAGMHREEAAKEFAEHLVVDQGNYMGLEHAAPEIKSEIVEKLMERGFKEKFLKAFTKK